MSSTTRTAVRVAAPILAALLASGCVHSEQQKPAVSAEGEGGAASQVEPALVPASGRRAPGATSNAAEAIVPSSSQPVIDPAVIQALEKMGAFLRELRAFAIKADTTTDELLENGQKIQLSEVSDQRKRHSFYDGKTFTLYGPRHGYYATFDAPPTLRELIDVAEQRYNVEFPLVDLFYWGTEQSGIRDIQSAIRVGPSKVGDVDTDHYALQQPDVDWQIWIQRGAQRLPRKLVITSKRELGQPQFSATLGWNLAPNADDSAFVFQPPSGARRVVFEQASR
jgi:hypothetical protein